MKVCHVIEAHLKNICVFVQGTSCNLLIMEMYPLRLKNTYFSIQSPLKSAHVANLYNVATKTGYYCWPICILYMQTTNEGSARCITVKRGSIKNLGSTFIRPCRPIVRQWQTKRLKCCVGMLSNCHYLVCKKTNSSCRTKLLKVM